LGVPLGLDPVPSQNRWVVKVDGEEIEHLRQKKVGEVSDEEWDVIKNTAASILSQCPPPVGQEGSITGLALGKVQSGKTLSYTSLIALAVDNGYRISVVLAGTKNPLLEQNYTRLCKDLDTVSRPTLIPFRNPVPQDGEVIQHVLRGKGNVLIVILKNRTHIENTRRILSAPELRNYPTLIIDDEGDEASLNTQFKRGGRSTIYRSILTLREVLNKHAYIAYTATPQANLLISGIDVLSPDFGVLILPGGGYCGGSVFFGSQQDKFIKTVPNTEAELDQKGGIQAGLKLAIATFLVGGAMRHIVDPIARHSMLIHNSNLKIDHLWMQEAVRALMAEWRETIALPENDPAIARLMELFRAGYDDLCRTVDEFPTWGQVKKQLPDELLLEVWMVNSLPLGRDPVSTPFRLRNNILVGGNMLGRGVTIPGLAVTYITRIAHNETNADTLEQRARWFGYKTAYLSYCRIFLTDRLVQVYTELLRHEDDFWEALRRNQRQFGLRIREWVRLLALDTDLGLRPTRPNVADYKAFRSFGWDIQRKIVTDRTIAGKNVSIVRAFFNKYKGVDLDIANTKHTIIRECSTQTIIEDLLSRVQSEGTDWENSYTKEYLSRLVMGNLLPFMDVILMSQGTPRVRSIAKDANDHEIPGQIDNPMQGRTDGKKPTERDYYPGDENIHNGRPQLQIHLINPRGSDLVTSIFALYLPADPRFDLRYITRDDVS
jgi:hypothetical protein